MRLIDAEAAKNLAEEFYPFVEGCAEVRDVKDFLNCCSTIEAKPVVHAHWEIDSPIDSFYCSNCGNKALRDYFENEVQSDYCPCCGAQMAKINPDTHCGAQMDEPISQAHENGVKVPVVSMEDVPKIVEETK